MKFNQRINRIIAGSLSLVMASSMMLVFPASAEATESANFVYDDYSVSYNVTDSWGSTEKVSITLTNTGENLIENWMLYFDPNGEVTSMWDVTTASTANNITYFKNAGYNSTIAPDASVTFNYFVDNCESIPDSYTLCQKRAEKSEGYDVDVVVDSSWGEGFNGTIIITNSTDKPIEDWELVFDTNFTITEITSSWSGTMTALEPYSYMLKGSYTSVIEPNSSVRLGFSGVRDGEPVITDTILTEVVADEDMIFSLIYGDEESDINNGFYAFGEYDEESNAIGLAWSCPDNSGSFSIFEKSEEKRFITEVTDDTMYIWEISDTDAKNEYVFVIEKQISESETIVSNDVVMHLNDDGTYDFVYIDSDGDGLSDVYELELGTDILNPDTDGDGLPDGYEYFTLETNPLKPDTDDNGVLDGNEDFDGDGLINLQEYLLGTNPFAFDTDNDGFSDNYEVTHKMNPLVYNEILTDNSIIADINDNTVNDLEILNMDEYYPLEIEFNDENTQVTSISGVFSDVIVKSPIEAIYSIYNVKSLLGLNNPETELKLSKVSHSNSGETYSFLQYYNGIEVYGSSLTVSVDTDGKVTSLSSSIISANIFENLCLVSNLSETDLQNVIHNEYENSEVISSQKAIYLTNKSSVPQLIYISTISDNGMYFIVFIDANSGNIIEKNDTMLYEMVAASGKNENDDDIKFEVNKTGKIFKKYTLEDINRKVYMYNCNDYNKQYTSKNNEWLDKTANSAYDNIVKVYDWWKRFNYIGLDGKGNNVNVYIHHPYLTDNAGFSPMKFELYFGDSTESFVTLASRLDACGHEYGHAVFTTRANCYVAADVKVKTISEAYADIFGSFVNNNTWTTQKRNIVDPNVTHNPSSTEDYAAIHEAGENGIDLYDPHYESTIISHAAYLMQNDYNIDFDKLSVLWYDSLSEGYDFYSDYNTVRDNVIKSARKNNFTYNEISNIMQAFDDVGIYADKGIAEISVYDGEEPVADAKITLINYGYSKEIYTDSTGTATFSNQNAGRNTVKIEITGQEPIYTQILIVKDKATKRRINILTSTSNFDWNVYDHYNYSESYSTTLPKHIVTNDNDIKMIGYSASPLKDFMLTNKNNDDTSFIHSSQKILSFNIKRDSNNWHTMEGGGFLFNVKVDGTNLSCHCILITSGGLKLYDIRNVNIDNFRNGDLGDISQVGKLLGTYDIGNVLDSHNITLRITDTVGLSEKTISVWDGDDLIIDNYLLLNSYGEDFGPITSHTRHACSQISYFTFSDIQMSNISQTEIE